MSYSSSTCLLLLVFALLIWEFSLLAGSGEGFGSGEEEGVFSGPVPFISGAGGFVGVAVGVGEGRGVMDFGGVEGGEE